MRIKGKRIMKNKVQIHSTYVKWTKNVNKLRHFSCSVNILIILLIIILIWIILFVWENISMMQFLILKIKEMIELIFSY